MTLEERQITIESGGVSLEGALRIGTAPLAAVVLHPHPQYGGDMHNHVVVAVCQTLAGIGATTLRFNFRGTGGSQGTYDGGRGEADDARAAVACLRVAAPPGSRLVLAGYSFGAMIGVSVAGHVDSDALLLISPPAGVRPLAPLPADIPVLLITGEDDSVAPPSALVPLAGPGRTVVTVPRADHSWWPGLETLTGAITKFVCAQFGAVAG